MNFSDLNNIDLKNLGTAPTPIKAGAIALLCAALAGGGYYFDTQKQLDELKKVEAVEGELRQTFETKQKKAANLDLYKVQLEEMRRSFGAMLRQLPSETEIPSLIVDISQTGLATGLEIDLFKPGPEVRKDFYAEKPIQLRVRGDYHEFGKFASGVAALPRIVTLHNITLSPGKDGGLMTMEATAKTYRYLEDGE
jgi:type IV pilus assembly protein PilO